MKFSLSNIVATTLFLVLALPSCSGCEEKSDEARIRALFNFAVEMAERKDIGDLMDIATDDFKASPGSKDRREVKAILMIAFRKYGKFSIKHPSPSVDVDPSGDFADAETPFLVVREGSEAPDLDDLFENPQEWAEEVAGMADLYNLSIQLVKEGDKWLVHRAKINGFRRLEDI